MENIYCAYCRVCETLMPFGKNAEDRDDWARAHSKVRTDDSNNVPAKPAGAYYQRAADTHTVLVNNPFRSEGYTDKHLAEWFVKNGINP